MKKALIVGIDKYAAASSLTGCVSDATQMVSLIEKNGDGSPNFDVKKLVSSERDITSSILSKAIKELLSAEADTAFFYFAGHGILNEETNNGHLVTCDGKDPNWGVSLSEILELANNAYPKIKSTVIVLDSCQSGYAGEVSGLTLAKNPSIIATGITILTACHREGVAAEDGGHGAFTAILLDGLAGSAVDVMGRITPASLYAHVDQTLGAWEQRPIYKANVQRFITLREVEPKVSLDILKTSAGVFSNTWSRISIRSEF